MVTYKELYHENRESGIAAAAYGKRLAERCAGYNKRFETPFLVPHRVFSGRLQSYDEMNVLLHHMAELYSARGVDTRPLKSSIKKYIAWLTERKADYNRKRSTSFRWLERELEKVVSTGEISVLLGNERLAGFFREIVLEKKVFDYLNLELIPPDSDAI